MLKEFTFTNYRSFSKNVFFSMESNKKLGNENTNKGKDTEYLKTSILYGPNNSGKTNFIKALETFKYIFIKNEINRSLLQQILNFNYSDQQGCYPIEFEMTYYDEGCSRELTYGINVLPQLKLEDYLYLGDELIYSKNINEDNEINKKYFEDYDFFKVLLNKTSETSLFINNIYSNQDIDKDDCIFQSVKRLFKKIEFLDYKKEMNDFLNSTERSLKKVLQNQNYAKIYNYIIKNADLGLQEHVYVSDEEPEKINENDIMNNGLNLIKNIASAYDKYISKYKRYDGSIIEVKSLVFDSSGTQKLSYLLSEIIIGLFENKILIIDEFNEKLHYKLARELISFINEFKDTKAQFILTSHDIKLLTPTIFRKDQIYFVNRNNSEIELYSLNSFPANNKSGVDLRKNTLYERVYDKGLVGGIPNPDFFDAYDEYTKYGDIINA